MPAFLRQLEDRFTSFKFCVEIDGVASSGFNEITGMEIETDVIEYREGCDGSTPRKFRGLTKYSDITLKRGMSSDLDAWNLQRRTFDAFTGALGFANPAYRFDMYIIQQDMSGAEVRVWKVEKAWVSKYTITDFSGDGSEVAMEEITVANEGWFLES